eukprot:EG_transcript_20907
MRQRNGIQKSRICSKNILTQNAARRLLPFVEDLEADLLDALARMLSRVNPFVHLVQHAAEHNAPNFVLRITGRSTQDRRRYNRPTAQEIGAFIPDVEAETSRVPRAIVVYVRGRERQLKYINEFNAAYYQDVPFLPVNSNVP